MHRQAIRCKRAAAKHKGKLAIVGTAAGFVAHHSVEAIMFKLFELISANAGIIMAGVALAAIAVVTHVAKID